jgi:hypothetical protein
MSQTESFIGKFLDFPEISEKVLLLKSPISDVEREILRLPLSLPLNRPAKEWMLLATILRILPAKRKGTILYHIKICLYPITLIILAITITVLMPVTLQ